MTTLTNERLEELRDLAANRANAFTAAREIRKSGAEQAAIIGELLQRREAAEKPFMYGIADSEGNPHFDECCVGDAGLMQGVVDTLNDVFEDEESPGYEVVALFREQPIPSAERERLEKYANERNAENQDLMVTIGKLRVEREQLEERLAAYDRAAKEPAAYQYRRVGDSDWEVCKEEPLYLTERKRTGSTWEYRPLFTAPPLPVVSTRGAVAWRWFDGRGYNSTTDKKQADELVKDGVAVEALGPLQVVPVVPDAIDAAVNEVLAVDTIASTAVIKSLFDQYTGKMRLDAAMLQLSGNPEHVKSVCQKCGSRGSYHCPQMLGTVECECTFADHQPGKGGGA